MYPHQASRYGRLAGACGWKVFLALSAGGVVGLGYRLSADDWSYDGFRATAQQVSGQLLELLDPPKIIYNPAYVSQIRGLTPLQYEETLNIIQGLRRDISQLASLDRRHFEQVVAELVRVKGFEVEVTKKTRDGGYDIVGIAHLGGIPLKLFVECKRKDVGNSVGVGIVRSVYGVHQTHGGPNKSIIASTTHFSDDAKRFASREAQSEWDLSLFDFEHLVNWINQYPSGH